LNKTENAFSSAKNKTKSALSSAANSTKKVGNTLLLHGLRIPVTMPNEASGLMSFGYGFGEHGIL